MRFYKDSTVKDNKSKDHSYFEEFTLWILIKHMKIQSRITALCHFYFDIVLKIQQSKITVNKSKVSSYFEEFPFYVCDKDSGWSKNTPEKTSKFPC